MLAAAFAFVLAKAAYASLAARAAGFAVAAASAILAVLLVLRATPFPLRAVFAAVSSLATIVFIAGLAVEKLIGDDVRRLLRLQGESPER